MAEIKIVAEQGAGSGRYLLFYGDGAGRVADTDAGVLWPIVSIDSILKAGYWEAYENDVTLLQTLLKLPEADGHDIE